MQLRECLEVVGWGADGCGNWTKNRYLAGAANEHFAHLTVEGELCLITLDAVRIFVLQDVFLPIQGLLAVFAVVALSHFD